MKVMEDIVIIDPVSPAETTQTLTEPISYPWRQIEDEPWLWYQRFIKYFLPQGPGRSIAKAYEAMVATEHAEVAEARRKLGKKKAIPAQMWSQQARKWDWRNRSKAYDKFTYAEALLEVDKARLTLLANADGAAKALVSALDNERLKVAAAKEILDRVGLPGTTNVGLGPIEKFTADEFRQAEQEVEEWEQKALPAPKPRSE